jgi:lactoylglutathione lyase
MQGITSLGHAAINVKDLDKSLAFYTGVLEFPEMLRLYKDDGSPWLIYLRITDDQYLELFPGAEQERAPASWHANGVTHLCLTVVDIGSVVKRLTDKGIKMLLPIKDGADGNRQAWIEDPDGNRIELMEMMPGSLQEKAIARLRRIAEPSIAPTARGARGRRGGVSRARPSRARDTPKTHDFRGLPPDSACVRRLFGVGMRRATTIDPAIAP